ncbi:hypothetical protein K402DRAFT_392884 [Aulographum hederae CBS 113979]|uniref:Extracellular membrane protein CFEM domain-containing protein n=1 Tax=Aulographum hederae CBS 113979 TaxID=1176131 RepID=A0A6G1H1Y5_9PEZI|nr:hypothetical protein K402DRAFT_392884 [Aulographum hederae CBS 113979]
MKFSSTTLLACGLVGYASATWDVRAPKYDCPANTDNQCTEPESSGFDWGNLPTGPVSSYNGYDFSGFQCTNKFGKRDTLSKRTFGSKCIEGRASKETGPSFSCGSDKKFSISEMQVSSSEDADVEFHYGMEDGSTCKQTVPCKSGGSVVQNSQCGGAKSVTVKLPQHGEKEGCDIGLHSIGFDCSPPSSTVPPSSSTAPPSSVYSSIPTTSSTPEVSTSSSAPVISSTPVTSSSVEIPSSSSIPAPPSSSVEIPSSSSIPAPPSSYEVPSSSVEIPSSSSVPAPPSSYEVPSSSVEIPSSSSIPAPPSSYEVPSSSVEIPSSSIPAPPSSYEVPSSSAPAVSSVPVNSSIPVPSFPITSVPVVSTTPVASTSAPVESSPVPAAPCPPVVPRCLNSWMFQTGCKDNSDASCYCKHADTVCKVFDCMAAWGESEEEIQQAMSYFVGICAAFAPENPAVVTCVPTSVTVGPTPPPSSVPVASSALPAVPSLPPVDVTTEIVTSYVTTCPIGQTVTTGSVTSVLTTPVVSTIYTTSTSTICTKCQAPPTPSAPAPPVVPSSVPGISTAPVPTSIPAPPAPPAVSSGPIAPPPAPPAVSSGPVAPPAPAPAPTSAPAVPYTTVTISQVVTVPCTYSTGESAGNTIPSSSTTSMLSTEVTVPQVGFTSSGSSVGLIPAGTPAPAPVPATTPAAGGSVPAYGTGTIGTIVVPSTTTGGLPLFTGGAAAKKVGGSLAFAGVVALFAL